MSGARRSISFRGELYAALEERAARARWPVARFVEQIVGDAIGWQRPLPKSKPAPKRTTLHAAGLETRGAPERHPAGNTAGAGRLGHGAPSFRAKADAELRANVAAGARPASGTKETAPRPAPKKADGILARELRAPDAAQWRRAGAL
ncbi:MAG TPA: hypothetical protein VKP14_06255 [Gaiellaceae bacterium]|nr:hypothetical protein [Gaiellaceae bacterium]